MVIRESRDQRLFDGFPGLFAAFHALHRLLAPRHPPYALVSLTTWISPSQRKAETHELSNDIDFLLSLVFCQMTLRPANADRLTT